MEDALRPQDFACVGGATNSRLARKKEKLSHLRRKCLCKNGFVGPFTLGSHQTESDKVAKRSSTRVATPCVLQNGRRCCLKFAQKSSAGSLRLLAFIGGFGQPSKSEQVIRK